MESSNTYQVEDETEETERQLELKKKEWELDHLQSLKEEEERKNAEEEDDMFFTYIRDETSNKVNNSKSKINKIQKDRKKASPSPTIDVDICTDDTISNETILVGPQEKIQERLKPLMLKLGDDKLAKIKKAAAEAIKANTNGQQAKISPKIATPKIAKTKKKVVPVFDNTPKISKTLPLKVPEVKKVQPKVAEVKKLPLKVIEVEKEKKELKSNKKVLQSKTVESQYIFKSFTPKITPTTNLISTDNIISPRVRSTKKAVTLFEYISTEPVPKEIKPNSTVQKYVKVNLTPKQLTNEKLLVLEKNVNSKTLKYKSNVNDISSSVASNSITPASAEQNGNSEKRRSSRTPRPKFMDDDWLLFS